MKFISIILYTFVLLCFLISTPAHASLFFAQTENNSYSKDDEFLVHVFMDTEGQIINAVSGEVELPETYIRVHEVLKNESVVGMWIEDPHAQDKNISFSGVTPGGFSGNKALLFSMRISSLDKGELVIKIKNANALIHDGLGTPSNVSSKNLSITIIDKAGAQQKAVYKDDVIPPQDFTPIIVTNNFLAEGKEVIIFLAEDKHSGIDHYEVREGKRGEFEIATSPYVIKNPELNDFFVKAVDKKGNEYVAHVKRYTHVYTPYIIFAILGVVIIVVIYYRKKVHAKK